MSQSVQKNADSALVQARRAALVFRCDMCGIDLENFNPKLASRCSSCEELITDWVNASTWKELINYNCEFIRGERHGTSYSMYPLFTDATIHSDLLRLHDYGFIVTDAQREVNSLEQDKDGPWYEVKDRAYLRCVLPTTHPHIPTEKVEEFIRTLFLNEALEVVSYYEFADYAKTEPIKGLLLARPLIPRETDIKDVQQYKYFFSSVGPSSAGRRVSKHRVADTKEELAFKPWTRCKHNGLPVIRAEDIPHKSSSQRAFGRRCNMTMVMRPVIVTVAVREWPPAVHNIVDIMEKICIKVGLAPLYAEGNTDTKELDVELTSNMGGLSLENEH